MVRMTRYRTTLSNEYRATLAALTGCVNTDGFEGQAAGEVLFMGATARKRGTEMWRVDYEFAILPNQADIPIVTESGTIHAVKKGWQYLWLQEGRKGAAANAQVEYSVDSVHVATVYPTGAFAALGL